MSARSLTAGAGPQGGGSDRLMVSLRLTGEARKILRRLSERRGIIQAAVLEILIRDVAETDASG